MYAQYSWDLILVGFFFFFQTQESVQVCMYKCESMKGNFCETVSFPLAPCGNERESVVSDPFLGFFFLEALKVQSANKDVFVPTHSCCKLEEVEEAKDES